MLPFVNLACCSVVTAIVLVCGSVVSRVYVYLYIPVFVEVAVFRGSVRFALIRFVSFFYGHDQAEIII